MAAVTVEVPDIGDFTDVPIIEILVKPGDVVAVEDALVTLESDKATFDVPAPVAGTVGDVLVKLGDQVSEGSAVVTIEPAAGEPEVAPGEAAPTEEAQPAAAAQPPDPAAPPPPAPPATVQKGSDPAIKQGQTPGGSAGEPVYASPSVRRRARELGVDLTTLRGSGRGGRVLAEDLERPVAGQRPGPAGFVASPGIGGAGERIPLTRIQQISRDNLTRAWQTIPHVTHHEDADITDLEAFRKTMNAEQSDVKVTMVALLIAATGATLRRFPRFASSLDGDEIVIKSDLHIGFAADTPNGLVVPVIRDVDRKGLLQIAGELTDLSGKARAGRLTPKELSGAVFTISSLGGIGGTNFTPIINPPQVCVLGAVRSAMRPVWDGSEFRPRLVLPLSLSYDHRVIDGADAARFMVYLSGVLGDLRRVLL